MTYTKKQKKELLKNHNGLIKQMNFSNKFFKIEYLQLNCNNWEMEDGKFITGDYYINGKIYSQNTLWCDNDNELVEFCWYNINNRSEEQITSDLYDWKLLEDFGVESDLIKVKLFDEDAYNEIMKNKLVLCDKTSSFNSFPQLNRLIEKFGYDKVLETLKSLEWIKTDGLEDFIKN